VWCKAPPLAEGLLVALTPLRDGMDPWGHGVDAGGKDRGKGNGNRG